MIEYKSIKDFPRLPPSRFMWKNSALGRHWAHPFQYNDAYNRIKLEDGWLVLGWNIETGVRDKKDFLKVLLWSDEFGDDAWFHVLPVEISYDPNLVFDVVSTEYD